jgi:hypothetical protein
MRVSFRMLAGSTRAGAVAISGFAAAEISGRIASASRIQRGQPSQSNPDYVSEPALLAAGDNSVP